MRLRHPLGRNSREKPRHNPNRILRLNSGMEIKESFSQSAFAIALIIKTAFLGLVQICSSYSISSLPCSLSSASSSFSSSSASSLCLESRFLSPQDTAKIAYKISAIIKMQPQSLCWRVWREALRWAFATFRGKIEKFRVLR